MPGYQSYLAGGVLHHNSGKTELGAWLTALACYGRDHPAVQLACRIHGIDPSAFPESGGIVCASALDSADSIDVVRPKLERYLPPGTKWKNRHGQGQAWAYLPNGTTVIFKTNDMGRDGFQGSAWDWLWLDEEHDRDVWQEATMRLIDRAGTALLTMTPLKGLTWVYDEFVDEPEAHYQARWISIFDNPHLPKGEAAIVLSKYGEHEFAARAGGRFTALEGRVYGSFSRETHVVEPFSIPPTWPRYRTIDFGTRNPTAILWAALDQADDRLYVYREHYQAGWTTSQHAEVMLKHARVPCPSCHGQGKLTHARMRKLPDPVRVARAALGFGEADPTCHRCYGHGTAEPPIQATVADPAGAGPRLELARDHGIATVAGINDIRFGVNKVAERMRIDVSGKPALFVFSTCRNTIREIEGYRWPDGTSKKDPVEVPVKKDDHTCDALRYLACYLGQDHGVN